MTALDPDALGVAARNFKVACIRADEGVQALYLLMRHGDASALLQGMRQMQSVLTDVTNTSQTLMGLLQRSEWIEGTTVEP